MAGILWQPGGFLVFLFLTLILGGAAAMASGAAIARTWRPVLQVPLYMIPLTLTVRFLNYALFQQKLLSVQYLLVTFVILTGLAMLGFYQRRRAQMQRQYGWLKT